MYVIWFLVLMFWFDLNTDGEGAITKSRTGRGHSSLMSQCYNCLELWT